MLPNYSCRMSKHTQTGLENQVEFNEIIRYEENNRGFLCQIPINMGHTCSRTMRRGGDLIKVMTKKKCICPSSLLSP